MPELTLICTDRASDHFPDSYEALDHLCRGCTMERGWVDMAHPRGDICPWMDEAQQYDGKPTVDVYSDGEGNREYRCHYRKEPKPRKPREHRKPKGQMALFS